MWLIQLTPYANFHKINKYTRQKVQKGELNDFMDLDFRAEVEPLAATAVEIKNLIENTEYGVSDKLTTTTIFVHDPS